MTADEKHARFCAMAGTRTALWRPVLGITASLLLITAVIAAAGGLLYAVVLPIMESRQLGSGYSFLFRATTLWGEIEHGTTVRGAILQLLLVAAVILPTLRLTLRLFHRRPMRSLFGPSLRINWRDLMIGAAVVIGGLVLWPMAYFTLGVRLAQPVGDWLLLLPLALPVILVQSMAEEMLFRGYLQQQLGALSKNAIVWLAIPSALFGLMHYSADAPQSMMVLRIGLLALMGAIAGILTAHTGNLGAAIGIHFGNNIVGLLWYGPGEPNGALLLLRWSQDISATAGSSSLGSHLLAVTILFAIYLRISRARL